MNFGVLQLYGEDGGERVIGSVSFNDDRSIGYPVVQNWSGSECLLQVVKGGTHFFIKLEAGVFVCKAGERNDNIGVVVDEASVEVGETKEGLDILDFPWLGPVLYDFDLVGSHGESIWRQDISEVFYSIGVKFTFVSSRVKTVFPQSAEDFFDVFLMGRLIGRINEDVVKVHDNTNIDHVREHVVHKPLENGRSVGESKRHD